MLENLDWWKIVFLVLLGLFIFGPERLPVVVRDAARFLRKMRSTARNATEDIRAQLGPDVELTDLHPKRLIRKHLLSEDEEWELRKPFMDAMESSDYRHIREQVSADGPKQADGRSLPDVAGSEAGRRGYGAKQNRPPGHAPRFDPDAT